MSIVPKMSQNFVYVTVFDINVLNDVFEKYLIEHLAAKV